MTTSNTTRIACDICGKDYSRNYILKHIRGVHKSGDTGTGVIANSNSKISKVQCTWYGCNKKAFYAKYFNKAERCKEHAEGRKMRFAVCECGKKHPNFSYKGERARCCVECKKEGMVNVKKSKCVYDDCDITPSYNYEGNNRAVFCFSHKKEGMMDVKSKRCEYEDCKRQSSYNYKNEPKTKFCFIHKKEGMIDVKSKRCVYFGCTTRPSYNYEGKSGSKFCFTHKKKRMIAKGKKCNHIGCNIRPTYNYKGMSEAVFCSLHRKEKMVNVISKRCEHKICDTIANYNYEGLTEIRFCTTHKKEGMVNIISKRCEHGGCNKQPAYNYSGKNIGKFCVTHKNKVMVNVKSKKCERENCNKQPTYNYKGEIKASFCSYHSESGMIDILSKKCDYENCDIIPNYNYKGEPKAKFCSTHKRERMVDVKNKKCPNCATWIDFQIANKKYDNYCARCFQHLFPKDPRTPLIRRKAKEILVRDFINQHFEDFIHDKNLYTHNCECPSRRRIDHRKLIENTMIAIETDEHQHRTYSSKNEEIRYNDVFMHFSGKWIWIRYNPDSYKDKNGIRKNPKIKDRLFKLKLEIEKHIKRIKNNENKNLIEIYKLFYNE